MRNTFKVLFYIKKNAPLRNGNTPIMGRITINGQRTQLSTQLSVNPNLWNKGKVFSVEIPNFIELEVTQTEPGVKGNTATNTLKPATVETGAEIRVPLFINEGDHIRIDTRTGEYMERV